MYQQPYYPPPRRTNSFAIASLICAFACAPAGIVLGIVARNQIRRTGEDGWGIATAGLICSIVVTVLAVLVFVGIWVFALWVLKEASIPPQ